MNSRFDFESGSGKDHNDLHLDLHLDLILFGNYLDHDLMDYTRSLNYSWVLSLNFVMHEYEKLKSRMNIHTSIVPSFFA